MKITTILLFLGVSVLSCVSYYFYAKKKQIVDVPNERSSHQHFPVRGMGLALTLPIILFFVLQGHHFWVLGLLLAIGTGYLDDRKNLKARTRLPLYLVALFLCTWAEPLLYDQFDIPWGIAIVCLIVALGIMNTYNFMDGINGITGLYSIVLFFTLYHLFKAAYFDAYWIYLLITAVLLFLVVFGFFNFQNKAKAFLGDSGSVVLGLLASALLILYGTRTHQWQIIVLLAVYGVDSVGTIILRILRKENIFEAHRSHVYQDLVHVKKWTHMQVAALYALLQLVINVILFVPLSKDSIQAWHVGLVLAVLAFLYIFTKKTLNQLNFNKVSHE